MKESEAWRAIGLKGEKEGYEHGLCYEIDQLAKTRSLAWNIVDLMKEKVFPDKIEFKYPGSLPSYGAWFLYPTKQNYGRFIFEATLEEANTARIMLCELLAIEAEEEEIEADRIAFPMKYRI